MKWLNKLKYKNYNEVRHETALGSICHAPSKSLLFTQGGKLMSCHYNRGYVLGVYPENNIEEIINGEKLKSLQNKLQNYSFTDSCWFCQQDISNGRYFQSGCIKYDYLSEFGKSNDIVSLEFQTDNICNLQCIMCSGEYSSEVRKNREKGKAYISPYDDNFIKQIKPLLEEAKFLNFTGGEPFLNKNYYKIWDYLCSVNSSAQITISTNGTILNEKILEYFQKLNFSLTISIDTLDAENFEYIRQNASFEKVFGNINKFIEIHKNKSRLMSIKTVLMDKNIDDLPQLFEYFNNKNIQIYPKLVWAPVDLSLRYSSKERLKSIVQNIENYSFRNENDVQKFNTIRYNEIIENLKTWHSEESFSEYDINLKLTKIQLSKKLQKIIISHISQDEIISNENRDKLLLLAEKLINDIEKSKVSQSELAKILSFSIPLIINEFYRQDNEKFLNRLISKI